MASSRIESPTQPTAPESQLHPEVISREMTPDQVASVLAQHGVKDISDKLDFQRLSSTPFTNGGFGSIYQGQLQDGQLVAIKRISVRNGVGGLETRGKRCKHAAHELYTWSKCSHPGVLKALGFILFEGFVLLVSPWMRNGSLIDYLAHESSCNRMKLCIELAEIVEYLHGKGIVHGDIKADNVLVSDSRDARLADFGSATLDEYRTLLFTSTLTELPCSIRFAAPEILDESSQKHTAQSDIYALGMTILQILTGKPPYAEMSNRRVLANVFRGVFPPKPELDGIIRRQYAKDELWNLLLRCWKHDPNLRPTATVIKRTLIEIKRVESSN